MNKSTQQQFLDKKFKKIFGFSISKLNKHGTKWFFSQADFKDSTPIESDFFKFFSEDVPNFGDYVPEVFTMADPPKKFQSVRLGIFYYKLNNSYYVRIYIFLEPKSQFLKSEYYFVTEYEISKKYYDELRE